MFRNNNNNNNNSKNPKTVVRSAIVVIPDKSIWDPIQNIRKIHDPVFERWPPHINMIYPFVEGERFEEGVQKVQKALSQFSPFQLQFNNFNSFPHGYMWLEPTNKDILIEIQRELEKAFPFCKDVSSKSSKGFQPHLTCGVFQANDVKKRTIEFQKLWTPIQWTVSELYLINRWDENPFEIIYKVPLGGGEPELITKIPKQDLKLEIFVKNLPDQCQEKDLEQLFIDFQIPPKAVTFKRHPKKNTISYAFVAFQSEEDYKKALSLSDVSFQDSILSIKPRN